MRGVLGGVVVAEADLAERRRQSEAFAHRLRTPLTAEELREVSEAVLGPAPREDGVGRVADRDVGGGGGVPVRRLGGVAAGGDPVREALARWARALRGPRFVADPSTIRLEVEITLYRRSDGAFVEYVADLRLPGEPGMSGSGHSIEGALMNAWDLVRRYVLASHPIVRR